MQASPVIKVLDALPFLNLRVGQYQLEAAGNVSRQLDDGPEVGPRRWPAP